MSSGHKEAEADGLEGSQPPVKVQRYLTGAAHIRLFLVRCFCSFYNATKREVIQQESELETPCHVLASITPVNPSDPVATCIVLCRKASS